MCSSAILEMIGVSDIGRKCLLISLIGRCLGTGITFASFQAEGSRPS